MHPQCDDHASITRRHFVKASLAPAALAFPAARATEPRPIRHKYDQPPEIIDTNVHLFPWPFRRLKYAETQPLIQKLQSHRITRAWAGSFEALLHKQLDAANRRLFEECRDQAPGVLIPFGTVNPAWPHWEDDLRRCHEHYHMPGIRLYPAYHGYGLDHPEFLRLMDATARRGMLLQIAIRMEDERVHHPGLIAPAVDSAPLPQLHSQVPAARIQLLNADTVFRSPHLRPLIERTTTTFDIAALEGDGGISRLIAGTQPNYTGQVPVDRLLFGSHAPFFPCESALLKLFESPLDRPQLDAITHANARSLIP